MMDDKQLNKQIAGRMGWDKLAGDAWVHRTYGRRNVHDLPDYLAPERLPELLDLACKVLGLFDLGWRDPGWICQTGTPTCEAVDVWAGPTPSLPLARAIVAFKEASHEA